MPATSPSTGETFASVAVADLDDVDRAVKAARAASPGWAAVSAFERAACCESVAGAIHAHRDELARALSQDQGKPLLTESYAEVDELAEYFHMAGEDAKRLEGSLPPSTSAEARVLVYRVPLGVVAVVSPWNWPYTMGAEVFAPALGAGNAVIWNPSSSTAACSGLLAEVIVGAGLPSGVFNFLPGSGAIIGNAIVAHAGVDAVGFVGSVATGRKVATAGAGKTQVLELGGNGPMVILEDADLELATEATLEAAYLCAGQSCTAGERFLVHASVRAEYLERVLAATAEKVRLGNPLDPSTTMGPLNNESNAQKFDEHVADARAHGATVRCGGERAQGFPTQLYAEATVLDGVSVEMLVAREETFGPVVPVIEVNSDSEALEITNASPFGLTAAVFTEDLERGLSFAEATRAGWVNINASTNLWESHLPFGGRSGSLSGRGRVGGRSLFEAFTEPKTVHFPAPRRHV
jgi:succinate-semialdehyde dehydrogenase/glutarate-semialdehyde dehydrogenase